MPEEQQIARFWRRVIKRGPDDCWLFGTRAGKPIKDGYGVFYFKGVREKAHRLAYELSSGPLAKGMFACHKCDNPKCCNPRHLFQGTPQDNTRDCAAKGRLHRESGSDRYNAKLTEEQVAIIKAEAPFRKYGWGRAIAKRFGVGNTAINNIIMGRRWKQVDGPVKKPASKDG